MALERIMGLYITDEIRYQKYREGMMPILQSYGGRFSYDFKVSDVLISKTPEKINRVFNITFPDQRTMEQFFSDLDYLKLKNEYFLDSVSATTVISIHDNGAT